jgi:molybdenum cofactor cytidylyltransferase
MQGILLAAGFGRRFQVESVSQQDKLFARLPNQQTVLWHSANALITAIPNSIAVVQPQQIERKVILQEMGYVIVESARAELGMGYAIADAVQATKTADGWLIALADMPWVKAVLIEELMAMVATPQMIAAPRFNGKRGQPVAFGVSWYTQLIALQGGVGARELLKTAAIEWLDWHDDSIHQDVDTQQDIM